MRCCSDSGGGEVVRASEEMAPCRRAWIRRVAGIVRWALPVAGLAFVPKCPGCVAAYVLLLTGVGLSFEAAEWVRWGLIGLCVAAMGWMAAGGAWRLWTREKKRIGSGA